MHMPQKSKSHINSELKKMRMAFYKYQFTYIVGLPVLILLVAIAGSFIGEPAAISILIVGLMSLIFIEIYFKEKVLLMRCPNSNAYFYSIFKWPLIGFIIFFWFSDCKKCGLNLHGKNTHQYT